MQHRLGETSCSGRQVGGCESYAQRAYATRTIGVTRAATLQSCSDRAANCLVRWTTGTASSKSLRGRKCTRICATASLEVPSTSKLTTVTVLPDPDIRPPQQGQDNLIQSPSIRSFLRGRRIFITGGTGFLGKVFIEKILFEQPEVEQIYLLMLAECGQSAEERLREEVIPCQVFKRLQRQYGDRYSDFMMSKLTAIEGDMAEAQMGLQAEKSQWLQKFVDVVVNAAATTKFDERFDVAVRINTLGAQEVADFARGCENLQVFVHVSTAFVNGLRRGSTSEDVFEVSRTIADELMGDSAPPFDVYDEVELALHLGDSVGSASQGVGDGEDSSTSQELVEAIKAYGMNRAQLFGWQDTYAYTKAMGEMLVYDLVDSCNIPTAVIRPSIVEGAYREPLRGWMEGLRLADPIILSYGKGQVDGFVGYREGVLDVVPVDYVINAMLAAMTFCAGQAGSRVFHVATSEENPLGMEEFARVVTEHFHHQPMTDRGGKPIEVRDMEIYATQHSLLFELWRRYQLPLEVAEMQHRSSVDEGTAAKSLRKQKAVADRAYQQLSYLSQLYTPYTFCKASFGASNALELSGRLRIDEKDVFSFDVRDIDWAQYWQDVHIPGLRKYVLNE